MKITAIACAAICAFAAVSHAAPVTDEPATNNWSARVGDAAKDASVLKSVMAELQSDKAAQLKLIAEVNAAIAQMPVSPEAQAQYFANAAKVSLESVSKDNVTAATAEIYATVPVEQLPVVNDILSKTCFNRNADATKSYSDAEFTQKAQQIMDAVSARVAKDDVSYTSERDALAIDMLAKASGGTPAGLANDLADRYVPESDREDAKTAWLPEAAKGEYTSINAAAHVDEASEPDLSRVTIHTTGAGETGASLLASIGMGETPVEGVFATPLQTGFNEIQDGLVNEGLWRIPGMGGGDDEEAPAPRPPAPGPLYPDEVP